MGKAKTIMHCPQSAVRSPQSATLGLWLFPLALFLFGFFEPAPGPSVKGPGVVCGGAQAHPLLPRLAGQAVFCAMLV